MSDSYSQPKPEQSPVSNLDIPLERWEGELRDMLPTMPAKYDCEIVREHFGEPPLESQEVWQYAVSGATLTPTKMRVTIDERIAIDDDLLDQLRETYYHESYHLARGYSFESVGLTLLDVALEEGLATKFEVIRTGSNPLYGKYDADPKLMTDTLAEVISADKKGGAQDWYKWKFYDPETDRHWILYRVGTFIVDDVLANNPSITIEDLSKMTREEILNLSTLSLVVSNPTT